MNRRELIALLGGGLVAHPFVARAQARVYTIGGLFLGNPDPNVFLKPFREGLRDLGYTEDRNIRLEIRSAEGQPGLLPEKAAELVRLKVDAIVAWQTPPVIAARRATSEIPIVMAGIGDPIGTGLVTSFARPGGNVTGTSSGVTEVAGKSLELIREVLPAARRIGVLANETDPFTTPYLAQLESSTRRLGFDLDTVMVRPTGSMDAAFETLAAKRVDAVIIQGSVSRREAAELALKHRLPSTSTVPVWPSWGGLMSYASSGDELYRAVAGSTRPCVAPGRLTCR
jgi:ABC-type uncharacterized transport system substrate-binding protein